MKLSERLTELVDHRVMVMMPEVVRDECTIKGTLKEAGEDYLMITKWDDIAGFTLPGQCYIKIDATTPIIHADDCKECQTWFTP